jgi:hypothetical protein
MRHQPVACFGNHALETSARKGEALTELYRADPTASNGMELATLDAGLKHTAVEVRT